MVSAWSVNSVAKIRAEPLLLPHTIRPALGFGTLARNVSLDVQAMGVLSMTSPWSSIAEAVSCSVSPNQALVSGAAISTAAAL